MYLRNIVTVAETVSEYKAFDNISVLSGSNIKCEAAVEAAFEK